MRPLTTLLMLILSSTLLLTSAHAAPPAYGLRADAGAEEGRRPARRPLIIPAENLSLDEAVKRVRKRTEGRILEARTVQRNGQRFHRIKVLTKDKRVRVIRFDARGGGSQEE